MERIEALISKLKEQFEQKVDPSLLLGTVQLLQFELTKLKSGNLQSLGTAKVAVMLPAGSMVGAATSVHEKYAPKPVEIVPERKENKLEQKETVLVDNGTLSVVQKNGQLDMVFDPMTEIPTLSHQSKEKRSMLQQKQANPLMIN